MISSTELKAKITIIQSIIENVKKEKNLSKNEDIENYFWENHSSLMNTYPFLITQLIGNDDLTMLNTMIQQIEEIEKGNKTQNEVDIEIGEQLADKYLDKNKFK